MSVDRFLTAKTAAGKSRRTVDFYRAELACAADWLRAHGHTLEDAGPEDIEQYLAAERLRNLSPASIEAHYRALSAFYRWLHSRSFGRLKNQQPGDHWIVQVERPANPKREPRRATPEQVETLLASIDPLTWLDWRDRALVRVMFWSGLRVSEAIALTVADLDMANRRIRVQHGKGDKPRTVRYHPAANADLLHYLYSRPDPADVRLWLSGDGSGGVRGALTDNGVRQMLRRRCLAAGVKIINPHSLRHGFAMTMLNDGGAPLEAVAKMLGHASPEITRRFYADYVDEELNALYDAAIDRQQKRRESN